MSRVAVQSRTANISSESKSTVEADTAMSPLLGGHTSRNAEQQHELREARRLLKERVRSDWAYPTLPTCRSSGRREGEGVCTVAGFRFHGREGKEVEKRGEGEGERGGGDGGTLGLGFEVVEWREREYSTETEDESDGESGSVGSTGTAESKESAYKFDGPDSVGAQIVDRRVKKRRKRVRELEREMGWNEGLAHWVGRRDEWCGAVPAAKVRGGGTPQADDAVAGAGVAGEAEEDDSPRPSTSSSGSTTAPAAADSPPTITTMTTRQLLDSNSSAATTPDLHPPSPNNPTTTTPNTPTLMLIPIPPPLLPNHPIRRRISSHLYPEIFQKIVQQSRTPSVPINLRTLVTAMVAGWKETGEWPPKTTAPAMLEPLAGKRKPKAKAGEGGGFRHGVKAVGRVLRLTGTGEVGVPSATRQVKREEG